MYMHARVREHATLTLCAVEQRGILAFWEFVGADASCKLAGGTLARGAGVSRVRSRRLPTALGAEHACLATPSTTRSPTRSSASSPPLPPQPGPLFPHPLFSAVGAPPPIALVPCGGVIAADPSGVGFASSFLVRQK